MTHWQDRKAIGDAHEQRVTRALRAHGWTVHGCGQGVYPPAIRRALARTESALRYFPDLIAARGDEVVTIDAKDRMPSTHTDRYAISTATLRAGLLFTGAHLPTPLYYVFGDLKVLTPSEVHNYAAHARPHRSGAWVLVATHRAHPFEEVFGASPALAA
ncbi:MULTISPECIES: hypothetical protein [unclassified Streptomyces]|uniref:hypothetical protein n=1 Tax=unclassified Streptomyces TaxID=2593676 RepID=UPI002253F262|nr:MULTISPECIES: hypothetical protein [unclassified Streptomyces]MCX4650236.1 hypothetical protein [Streptomyces sp. NBC_01446]MCX5327767.1 hypothetical protein [Streptomyces sp. NBC_00120]